MPEGPEGEGTWHGGCMKHGWLAQNKHGTAQPGRLNPVEQMVGFESLWEVNLAGGVWASEGLREIGKTESLESSGKGWFVWRGTGSIGDVRGRVRRNHTGGWWIGPAVGPERTSSLLCQFRRTAYVFDCTWSIKKRSIKNISKISSPREREVRERRLSMWTRFGQEWCKYYIGHTDTKVISKRPSGNVQWAVRKMEMKLRSQ